MSDQPGQPKSKGPTREERLAARLRENLHRRKQQARALDSASDDEQCGPQSDLPKPDASR